MKKTLFLFFLLALLFSACKKNSNSLAQNIQGKWIRDCGCVGLYIVVSGNNIYYYYTPDSFSNFGYIDNNKAYLVNPLISGAPNGGYYPPASLSLSADGQKLSIGMLGDYGRLCTDSVCTDTFYHRIN